MVVVQDANPWVSEYGDQRGVAVAGGAGCFRCGVAVLFCFFSPVFCNLNSISSIKIYIAPTGCDGSLGVAGGVGGEETDWVVVLCVPECREPVSGEPEAAREGVRGDHRAMGNVVRMSRSKSL